MTHAKDFSFQFHLIVSESQGESYLSVKFLVISQFLKLQISLVSQVIKANFGTLSASIDKTHFQPMHKILRPTKFKIITWISCEKK